MIPRAFLFDMDGTLIDNMMVHHRAWQSQLRSLGIDWSLAEVKEKVHGVNVEILERLFGDRFSPAERRRISDEKEAAYRRIYANELVLLPGLEAFLDRAKLLGIPMAVATAAPADNALWVMKQLQLDRYFSVIRHAGDVQRGKPDPQVFELAADALGVAASDCLIFEDSVTGAEAAKRAEAKAVILTTTHDRAEFADYEHILAFGDDYGAWTPEDFFGQ